MNKRKNKSGDSYWLYDFVKITAGLPGILWFRPKVWYENERARERLRGGALLIANHIGFLDPIALQFCVWYRRHHFVCLDVFFEKPVSAWFFKRFHCIPVDRENFSMGSLRKVVAELTDEKIVSMFPEGHMATDTSKTDAFKSGMVLMALMSKKPIVPIYIAPRKHFFSRLHMVMGEPEHIAARYDTMPPLSEIERITVEMQEHEERLRAVFEEIRSKK